MSFSRTVVSTLLSPLIFLAKAVLHRALSFLGMKELWDETILVSDDSAYLEIVLKGDLGLGEAFMSGKLQFKEANNDIKNPSRSKNTENEPLELQTEAALRFFRGAVDPATSKIYSWWLVPAAHLYVMWAFVLDWIVNLQSVDRSAKAISSHYDRSTKTIESMTAPSFVYTCGHWQTGATSITEAQHAKMALVCEKLGLPRKGQAASSKTQKRLKVLDIGCGYGALGKFMSTHFHVDFTGISISQEQVDWANKNVCDEHLKVVFCDYRAMPKEWMFDGIVSVGMFEAVGPVNYKEFMRVHEAHLNPDGIVVLHTITQCFSTRVNLSPWLIKYIFPDGTLPSPAQVFAAAEKVLVPEDMHQFGPDYADTLAAWRADWLSREAPPAHPKGSAAAQGDASWRRMWWLYLTMCEALFQVRHANLTQFVFTKRGLRDSKDILRVRNASHRVLDLQQCKTTTTATAAMEGAETAEVTTTTTTAHQELSTAIAGSKLKAGKSKNNKNKKIPGEVAVSG
mmetsp:Transcript_12142/g.23990  ORF Transcript_12142/g.23990 Transcript_12142/m.23990 type:complete len:511 (-) Transcript_12142:203-1735(-)